jgi:hypothetical protein
MNTPNKDLREKLGEVLPKVGIVIAEQGQLSEVLCKPKILPLRSAVLEQLKKLEEANLGLSDNATGN